MSTSIDLHIEVKIENKWHHYANPNPRMEYTMFGYMAGECRDETPIAQPRGLPEDMTFLTSWHAKRQGSDGRSHSWLGWAEIEKLSDLYEERARKYEGPERWFEGWIGAYLFGNAFAQDEQTDDIQDVRFVFWFS